MVRKNAKKKLFFWFSVVVIGFLLIFLADVLAEEIRGWIGQTAFLWITVVLLVIIFLFGWFKRKSLLKRIAKLAKGQIGI